MWKFVDDCHDDEVLWENAVDEFSATPMVIPVGGADRREEVLMTRHCILRSDAEMMQFPEKAMEVVKRMQKTKMRRGQKKTTKPTETFSALNAVNHGGGEGHG